MCSNRVFDIAVMPGDGIGPEITAPTLEVLKRVQSRVGGFDLRLAEHECGAGLYAKTGEALPQETLDKVGAADAILLAAMGLPSVRYPDGREITPQIDLREIFGLYAGVRPIKAMPGVRRVLADPRAADIDFVLIRESTEGLFSARGKCEREGDAIARDVMQITRPTCERLFEFTFNLARSRKAAGRPGRVTCVDKANVLGSTAFFREIFDEVGARHPDIERDYGYVDAVAMNLVMRPWTYDVMVTENMFGDILSDLGAGLVGGLGYAPSADIGDRQAVFQPCHGTAPDIMGKGLANPTAMILSAAMMLEWLGEAHDLPPCTEAGGLIRRAVDAAFADSGLVTCELGGEAGTQAVVDAVLARLG